MCATIGAQYREKFDALVPMLAAGDRTRRCPDAGFYLWARVPGGDDEAFARELFAATHVTVLPGRYLARDAHGDNPGAATCAWHSCPGWTTASRPRERIVEFCR